MNGNKLQEINLTIGGITTTSPTPLWCDCSGCGGHSQLDRRHSGDAKRLSTTRHPEGLRRHSPTPHGVAVVAARNRRFLEVLRSVSPAVGGRSATHKPRATAATMASKAATAAVVMQRLARLCQYANKVSLKWEMESAANMKVAMQIQALVDGKKVIVTETSVKRALQLKDAKGTECLPNATIFAELERMGYENLTQKLTFYKDFFSPQWKFLIHTVLQCLSAKTTAWNEFSSTMASAIIYLITDAAANEEHVPIHSNDPLLMEIAKLNERVKKLERRNKSKTPGLKRLRKVGRSTQVVSSVDEGLGQEDASKQGRKISDLDIDVEVTLVDEAQERNDDNF
ncbi:hypothetical protein Tco_0519254 [Tanacetum coccineum]